MEISRDEPMPKPFQELGYDWLSMDAGVRDFFEVQLPGAGGAFRLADCQGNKLARALATYSQPICSARPAKASFSK
jgi:hypothetical protein